MKTEQTEQMEELLRARIAQIKDPVQKILLQDVLADVFEELLKYTDSCFANLEHRIDTERNDDSQLYDIYTGVCKKDGLDAASRCLAAVDAVLEPGREAEYAQAERGYLGTLFLACKYPDVLQCLKEPHRAEVETDQGNFQIQASLSFSYAYREAFAWLYQQFGANRRIWHTPNCPFLYKMLDIFDTEHIIPKDASVLKVTADLGKYSESAMNDMVLVWNLSKEEYQTRAKEGAAGELSFYEHRILLPEPQSGYLVMTGEDSLKEQETFLAVRSGEELCVRTQEAAYSSVSLLKFNRMDMRKDQTALFYPTASNHRNLRHADRQAMGQPRYLWTKGETERILHSYEAFQDFELLDICPDKEGEIKSMDMNPFIQTHSMLKQKRKMALVLHPKDSSDIFQYEKMFFLLSELQLCTEEYEWTGIIRE